MIEVKHRDGAARYGIFNVGEKKVEIPNIIFIPTRNLPVPRNANLIETIKPIEGIDALQIQPLGGSITNIWISSSADLNIPSADPFPASLGEAPPVCHDKWCIVYGNEDGKPSIPNKKGCVFTLANAPALFPKTKIFLRNLIRLREKAGYNSLLHLPAVATPSNLSLLVYMGIDLVDTIGITIASRKGCMLFPDGSYPADEVRKGACSCPACLEMKGEERIFWHNYRMLCQEMERIKMALRKGKLRELVEQRVLTEAHLMEKFRLLHMEHYDFMEKRAPVTRPSVMIATSRDSIDYPEVRRFRERLIERYRKPRNAKIALFLPCSSKKPYSLSKSHKIFRRVISSMGFSTAIHEIIVTSPLGLVPRELEIVYPAIKYDIPITGRWYGEEREMIREILERYLRINKYDVFVSHLPGELNMIIKEVCGDLIETCIAHPLSRKSLSKLKEELRRFEQFEEGKRANRMVEIMKQVASFQFGPKVAEKLVRENRRIEGDYPSLKLVDGANLLASISKERGLLSLTLEGGKVLEEEGAYVVKVKEVKSKGSIFASEIIDADSSIRVGDDVAVLLDGKLCAVGIARMNGEEMLEMERGEAIRIRHHL